MRLVTFDELDAHREQGPDLIGSEAVEDIGEAGEMFSLLAGYCEEVLPLSSPPVLSAAQNFLEGWAFFSRST